MHTLLLSNAVLYFASSAAQVWAALMVFQVVLVRDLCLYYDQEKESITSEARRWLGILLSDNHKNHLAEWSKELGIDIVRILVRTAKGDAEAEARLLTAVSKHQLFRHRALESVIDGVVYGPTELQEQVDTLNARLTTMESEFPDPVQVFQTGVYSLALNLGALAIYGFLGDSAPSLIGILGALVVSNFALGWRFAAHIRRALVCY